MPESGQTGDSGANAFDQAHARRQALGRILRPRAKHIEDNTLGQAYRATNFFGFGAVGVKRWEAISARTMAMCLDAIEAGDDARNELLDKAAAQIRERRAVFFPRFSMKPLVTLGFRLAMREVKIQAPTEGFDPKALEDELRVYQRAFEARIMYR